MILHAGWFPGAIGGIAALHARHYAASHGFGASFEAKVAADLRAFFARASPRDFFRAAERDGTVLGSIALEDEGGGIGHLRWFILDAVLRGQGIGRAWLAAALAHAAALGLGEVYLWTLDGLPAAARLYAEAGFVEAERLVGTQWGTPTLELRLTRRPLLRG